MVFFPARSERLMPSTLRRAKTIYHTYRRLGLYSNQSVYSNYSEYEYISKLTPRSADTTRVTCEERSRGHRVCHIYFSC